MARMPVGAANDVNCFELTWGLSERRINPSRPHSSRSLSRIPSRAVALAVYGPSSLVRRGQTGNGASYGRHVGVAAHAVVVIAHGTSKIGAATHTGGPSSVQTWPRPSADRYQKSRPYRRFSRPCIMSSWTDHRTTRANLPTRPCLWATSHPLRATRVPQRARRESSWVRPRIPGRGRLISRCRGRPRREVDWSFQRRRNEAR